MSFASGHSDLMTPIDSQGQRHSWLLHFILQKRFFFSHSLIIFLLVFGWRVISR